MSRLSRDIRQHDTHKVLVGQAGLQNVPLIEQTLDAIIVPASRPAGNLDQAIALARAAGCALLILCSHHLRPAEVEQLLAERSFHDAIVIKLPDKYCHGLLDFPALRSLKADLPEACAAYDTDLSAKRNVGLILARMLGWRRIFFLDDDIRDINYPDLRSTVSMLGSFPTVGMRVTNYPDNSVVCHAHRLTGESQDVFVTGAALAVDCTADIGFFPDMYNEDWLFFYDDASHGRLASSGLKVTQLVYHPFADPQRAAWQEFGDVLAEGLYGLLHLGMGVKYATREYWSYFLEARRRFLEAIINRSDAASPDIRNQMLLSVESALKCSIMITPELCERYIRLWRQDLEDWKRRAAGIPEMPSIEAALQEMRLSPPARRNSTGKIRHRRDEAANITAGPVTIPRFDTLKELPEHASTLRFSSAAPAAEKGDTKPFPVLTPEVSGAMLAARTNGDDSPSSGDEGRGRHWKLRFSIAIPWMESIRDVRPSRLASAFFGAPPDELEPVGWSEPADPEPGDDSI
jgi:hypothetical protein